MSIFKKVLSKTIKNAATKIADDYSNYEFPDDYDMDEDEFDDGNEVPLWELLYNTDVDYNEEYFNRNPLGKPFCCRACGGPYPNCRWSCKIFDD